MNISKSIEFENEENSIAEDVESEEASVEFSIEDEDEEESVIM